MPPIVSVAKRLRYTVEHVYVFGDGDKRIRKTFGTLEGALHRALPLAFVRPQLLKGGVGREVAMLVQPVVDVYLELQREAETTAACML
jgi:hypothetical protein